MEHVRSELQNSDGNSNFIWKVLNRCLPHRDSPLSTTEDPFSQASKFNENYHSVGISAALKAKPLAEEHGFHSLNVKSIQPLTNSCLHDDRCRPFEFQPVMEKEVGKIIRSLPSNKAPGPDKVTARILKDSLPITLAKIAEVIPILKSGDPDKPSNTRPISLLPIMSKVCVRVARSQFVNFLDQNEKNSKLKSGNRIFHSTETALFYFTDEREKS